MIVKHKIINNIQYKNDDYAYYKLIIHYDNYFNGLLDNEYLVINSQTNKVVLHVLLRNSKMYGMEIVHKNFNKING